jgi:serine/threonine-protein kinase RsbW
MADHLQSAGTERLVYERTLPAVPIAVGWMRRELDTVLEQMGVRKQRRHDVALVLSEAAANVVIHAYGGARPGLLCALAVLSEGDLRLDVFDAGQGMTPRASSSGLGVGLALMARVSDALELAANESGGMQVSALFHDVDGVPSARGRSNSEELADYVDALKAQSLELGESTRALSAEAKVAAAQARRLCHERRRSRLA